MNICTFGFQKLAIQDSGKEEVATKLIINSPKFCDTIRKKFTFYIGESLCEKS